MQNGRAIPIFGSKHLHSLTGGETLGTVDGTIPLLWGWESENPIKTPPLRLLTLLLISR